MVEWKDYANIYWNSDGTVYDGVGGSPFSGGYTRNVVSTGSTNRPDNGQLFWTYDNAVTSGTQGMGMYLLMYIHNPNYNQGTNDALNVSNPSGNTEPTAPPGFWRTVSLPLTFSDTTTAEANNGFNYAA